MGRTTWQPPAIKQITAAADLLRFSRGAQKTGLSARLSCRCSVLQGLTEKMSKDACVCSAGSVERRNWFPRSSPVIGTINKNGKTLVVSFFFTCINVWA